MVFDLFDTAYSHFFVDLFSELFFLGGPFHTIGDIVHHAKKLWDIMGYYYQFIN